MYSSLVLDMGEVRGGFEQKGAYEPLDSDRKLPAAGDTLDNNVGSFHTTLLELLTCSFNEWCDEAGIPTGMNYEDAKVGAYISYFVFD